MVKLFILIMIILQLARVVSNSDFNEVMEATLNQAQKPHPGSTM